MRYYLALWKDRQRRRFLYDNADAYVLLSHRFDGEFRAMTDLLDTRKLYAIPNPVVSNKHFDLDRKRNEVLFVGGVSYCKGAMRLLESWMQVAARRTNWRLSIVGEGECMEMAQRYIADHHCDNVFFLGAQSNPELFFRRSKILASPSAREGWPMVLNEAMSYGCVPIAFDSYSSLREIVTSGKDGLIVPALDIDAFARALGELMDNDERLLRMSKAARESSFRYESSHVVNMWYELFKRIR